MVAKLFNFSLLGDSFSRSLNTMDITLLARTSNRFIQRNMANMTIHDAPTKKLKPNEFPQQAASRAQSILEHSSLLQFDSPLQPMRLSSLICTIGPSTRSVERLEEMLATGMNIVRLNFSHGTHEYHYETVLNVREAIKNHSAIVGFEMPVAIALDTKGPEIRTGLVEGDGSNIILEKGAIVNLTTNKEYENKCTKDIIYVDYVNMAKVVKPGNIIYLDDGFISLKVQEIKDETVTCIVENPSKLSSRKGVNLPGVDVDLPSVSEKDKLDLQFVVKYDLDIVFASFIRNAAAISEIRGLLGEKGKNVKIIAKIENQQAMNNINEIIEAADGIMVARGDLGIEIEFEKVFVAQKKILALCNQAGKPGICATQMLESMINKPSPTRAEVADISNAILDGADCVMLSGETAMRQYPLECVKVMNKVCKEAESAVWYRNLYNSLVHATEPSGHIPHAVAIGLVATATKSLAKAIIVLTTTGNSATLISKYRPRCPIIAVTSNRNFARQAYLYRGLLPVVYSDPEHKDWVQDSECRVKYGINMGRRIGLIEKDDNVVIVTGFQQGSGFTNTMRVLNEKYIK